MSTLLANPSEMIARGAPRLIHSDAELAAYTEALFALTALDHPSRSDADAIELLTLLIERYEQARFPIPAAKPVAVVRFLIMVGIGVAATLAWQSYGDTAREKIANMSPQLGWLAPQAAPVAQDAADLTASAAAPPDQQLNPMAFEFITRSNA